MFKSRAGLLRSQNHKGTDSARDHRTGSPGWAPPLLVPHPGNREWTEALAKVHCPAFVPHHVWIWKVRAQGHVCHPATALLSDADDVDDDGGNDDQEGWAKDEDDDDGEGDDDTITEVGPFKSLKNARKK